MKFKSIYVLALSVVTVSHSVFAEDKTTDVRDPKLLKVAEAIFNAGYVSKLKPEPESPENAKEGVYGSFDEVFGAIVRVYINSPEFKQFMIDDIYDNLHAMKIISDTSAVGINAVTEEQLTAAATAVAKASRIKNRMADSTDEAAVEANEVNYLVAQAKLKLIEDLREELIKQRTAKMLAALANDQDEESREPGTSVSERVEAAWKAKAPASKDDGDSVDQFDGSKSDP